MKENTNILRESNYLFQLKTLLVGALLTELYMLIYIFFSVFLEYSTSVQRKIVFWIIVVLYFTCIIIYLIKSTLLRKICILTKSLRLDLLIIMLSGVFFVYIFNGFGIKLLKNSIKLFTWQQLMFVFLLPILLFISVILKNIQLKLLKKNEKPSLFMNDREGKNKYEDKFNFLDQAEKFAERVYNNGSAESLVFGIDAPWGTGKSTFVNLCKEYWDTNHTNEMIVYTFEPLRYENKEHLLEKFVEGLIKEIKNHTFSPELESLVSRYSRLIKDSKATISFLGVSFGVTFGNQSIDTVFKMLESYLERIDKKIVIIIDDLDRLNFSALKEVLYVIKKAFTLPNISYVLCYDTDSIASLEQNSYETEKITEFLEKFINVKINLYLDNKLLLNYFLESKEKSISENLLANPIIVSKAVEGLKDIFSANDFHSYMPFIGDARKLKRLINIIILLEVEKTDFENYDFNKQDLIHLLLIYINYPNIFRKIYITETNGRRGFFSVVTHFDEGYPEDSKSQGNRDLAYKNSVQYSNYLEKLTDNQRFILNKLFSVKHRFNSEGADSSNINQKMISSYACFNGSLWNNDGRNLEDYLNLITKMSRPLKTKQYKFYTNLKDMIIRNNRIGEIFVKEEFSFSNNENSHEQLWRALVNSAHNDFTLEKSREIINYAVEVLPEHSLLEIPSIGVGFRHNLPLYIVILLDKVGWKDEKGKQADNIDKNNLKIAEWIFGEGNHINDGIIDNLAREDRGIMGLHDLLLFRLYCCMDRGGDVFNLSKALLIHGNPQAKTSGITRELVVEEMRKISQNVFRIFEVHFIDKRKNIFYEIDKLTEQNICGKYYGFINSNIESEKVYDLQTGIDILKNRMKSFILYQLGNSIIESGIGCGYYDIEGNKDEKGIRKIINKYLFGYCFNPKINKNNYLYFLDFLLMNFIQTLDFDGSVKYIPHIDQFTKVLDENELKIYWKTNKNNIQDTARERKSKKVKTYNYEASYEQDLDDVYKVLDTQYAKDTNL